MPSVTVAAPAHPPRVTAVLREQQARVTPLELFFDLVFVLAITQCTALMADEPTWRGLAKGVLVALLPAAVDVPALATLAAVAALLGALIVYEARRFAELRDRLRHQVAHETRGSG